MNKILCVIALAYSQNLYALSNNLFQEFDNQISIGYGWQQSIFSPYKTPTASTGNIYGTVNLINFEGEHLFNNGTWVDVIANMSFGAGPAGRAMPGLVNYANPSDYGINAKIGYAIPFLEQHLQLTPYAMVGLNNVYSSVITPVTKLANPQVANAYEYIFGVGARIEYRINNIVLLNADQLIAYNWDASGIQNGVQSQNNIAYTSTLGAKFNVVQNLQLGIKGFWAGFMPQSGASMSQGQGYSMYQLQSSVGGLVSVGLTY